VHSELVAYGDNDCERGLTMMALPYAEFRGSHDAKCAYRYAVLLTLLAGRPKDEERRALYDEYVFVRDFASLVRLLQELRQAFDWGGR
jgi:hypothetical protein